MPFITYVHVVEKCNLKTFVVRYLIDLYKEHVGVCGDVRRVDRESKLNHTTIANSTSHTNYLFMHISFYIR
jgi:hypothetical protein